MGGQGGGGGRGQSSGEIGDEGGRNGGRGQGGKGSQGQGGRPRPGGSQGIKPTAAGGQNGSRNSTAGQIGSGKGPYQIKENQGKRNKTGKRRRAKKTKEWIRSEVDSSCDSLSEFEEWLTSENHPLSLLCSATTADTEEQCICIRKQGRRNAKAKHVCGACVSSFKPTTVDGKSLSRK